jgi:Mu transposase-like protein
VRGSREFVDRAAYERFVQDLVRTRNQTRQKRFVLEREQLRPLPATPLSPCREVRVMVSRFSTIQVLSNTYSVPSRLIGTVVLVRVRAERLEGYVGTSQVFVLPRLVGKHQHRICYQHLIWSLVRKPGAFAAYRYRDDLYPTTTFRQAYDRLQGERGLRADHEYGHLLHLAASTSESEVETALALLIEQDRLPRCEAVRELVCVPKAQTLPQFATPALDLASYDALLPSRRSHA